MGKAAAEASDIYAIGVILYELLAVRRPFEGELVPTVALKHRKVLPTLRFRLNCEIGAGVDSVVLRALEKHPADRFPDRRHPPNMRSLSRGLRSS
jgi:serine/threonine-protein kinase